MPGYQYGSLGSSYGWLSSDSGLGSLYFTFIIESSGDHINKIIVRPESVSTYAKSFRSFGLGGNGNGSYTGETGNNESLFNFLKYKNINYIIN